MKKAGEELPLIVA